MKSVEYSLPKKGRKSYESFPGSTGDTEDRQKAIYLNGLRKFKDRGVRILLDGQETPEQDWSGLFRHSQDGGFYRCDHTIGSDGRLSEIHFDWIYNH